MMSSYGVWRPIQNITYENDLSTQQAPVVSHRKRVLVSPPINSWFDDGDVDAEDEEEEGGFGFPLFGRTFHIGIPVSIRNDTAVTNSHFSNLICACSCKFKHSCLLDRLLVSTLVR